MPGPEVSVQQQLEERAIEAVARALHRRFPTIDPMHVRIGVSWDELSEASRRSYRGRAVGVIAALDDARAALAEVEQAESGEAAISRVRDRMDELALTADPKVSWRELFVTVRKELGAPDPGFRLASGGDTDKREDR